MPFMFFMLELTLEYSSALHVPQVVATEFETTAEHRFVAIPEEPCLEWFHRMPSTALITGASSGIGAEFARQLAPKCPTLILVARRGERLDELRADLESRYPGLRVHTRVTDLAVESEIDALLDWLSKESLKIDLLINNAGLGDHGPFAQGDWERIRRMIMVNIAALTKLTYRLIPQLLEQQRAAILNVSSIASLIPIPNLAVYAATKAYVTSLSEALRAELRGTSVSVTALCPGPVDTEFSETAQRGHSGDRALAPDFFKVPAGQVVRDALNAVAKDRPRVIPGLLVAILMTVVASLPLFVLRLFLNQKR
jgi:short-subunit dehydrogenase